MDDCGLTFLHVFPFSPRKGTPAARMPQVARHEVKARAAHLREAGVRALERFLVGQQGCEHPVLMERDGMGRTPHFAEVCIAGRNRFAAGDIVTARITGRASDKLIGEVVA